ncbi:carbamoyl-phosphate synthase large subunit [Clostridium cavendishii DSM 21758]|uniref:Carbamoyl-phosphate synthase large subunit n=1 Tax=Clostridium cavendishii DSM 21758 TaxID=1121302 RepID=A0A1M6B0P5_9CLOT|nr:ATP-grasp domain-containing protein [Clostridium cavendishii]SHI42305.1 carbamoyl-phosphate synthase large subunit [Clostridium cavendishii DSM 21758]
MRILLTAIGKRVQLIKYLEGEFEIIGVDASDLAPASYFVNKFYKVPKFTEDGYIEELLKVCRIENIKVLIPLYELEFSLLSKNREKFNEVGTTILLSNTEIIEVCNDKMKTYEYLTSKDIECPKCYKDEEIEEMIFKSEEEKLPLIIKPRDGMGSSNVFKINKIEELEFFYKYVRKPLVQQFVEGDEYTVDVLCDFNGQPIYVVPRERLEVRAGEVVKSKTVKDKQIIDYTLNLIEVFNELRDSKGIALMGPLTFQFFKTEEGQVFFLELNPRFGGGVPLSIEAGANYGKAIKKMINGEDISFNEGLKELTMLRFDDSIFVK